MADITVGVWNGVKKLLRDIGSSCHAEVVSARLDAAHVTRSTSTVTIANGASVSDVVDLDGTCLIGFVAPAAWTTAALNIEVSTDNSTWVTAGLIDAMEAAVSSWSSVTAGAGYSVDAAAMLPWRYVRFRSGTSASPVNQGAARAFTVITRPIS